MTSLEMLQAVVRLLTYEGSQVRTSASGFLWRRDGRLYLATGLHVLHDERSGHAPDGLEVWFHPCSGLLGRVDCVRLPLYPGGRRAWMQTTDAVGDIDVAVLELQAALGQGGSQVSAFDVTDLARPEETWDVGQALLIPGYPLGFQDELHHLPVVRSASLASAHGFGFQGRAMFLTDSRTHSGSSGAPVLCGRAGPAGPPLWRVLGVHSSRLDMSGRDRGLDESLGLNSAWFASALLRLTDDDGRWSGRQ